jgi:hypothetical protein
LDAIKELSMEIKRVGEADVQAFYQYYSQQEKW